MKFYRAVYSRDGGNHGGFSWHTSHADAIRSLRKDYEEDPGEYQFNPYREYDIDVVEIVPTKAGILKALKVYATHPDNG